MRRGFLLLAVLMTPVWLGCIAQHTVSLTEMTAAQPDARDRFTRFATPDGQSVVGYTTTDGRYHKLYGRARLEGDAIVFHNEHPLPWEKWQKMTIRVPVADLESVRSEHVNTVLMVGGVVVFVVGAVALMAIAMMPTP